ncbi:MAG: hypothetical protein Kow0089_07530 [Desulfobulbaceae bacterium]
MARNLEAVASVAKSLGDANRLRILTSISKGKKSVSHIVEELQLSQPLVSHHLKELKRARLVTVERKGPFVYYQLTDPRITELLDSLEQLTDDLLLKRSVF